MEHAGSSQSGCEGMRATVPPRLLEVLPVICPSCFPTEPGLLLTLRASPAALQCLTDVHTMSSS